MKQIFQASVMALVVVGFWPIAAPQNLAASPQTANAATAPAEISLDEAIRRAQVNDPAYAATVAETGSAQLDRSISRAALLPSVTYHNQYLYTQPNGVTNQAGQIGSQAAPRFIANNAIREYASQALVTQSLSAAGIADLRRSTALATKAKADLEIAHRDLVTRVVTNYFTLSSATGKLRVAQSAADEAKSFSDLTRKLETGREVAHADVVKADLQTQQRERELQDAQLAVDKARLDLGVLLFPDPATPYTVDAGDKSPAPLPAEADVQAAAGKNNPDLQSALQALKAAHEEVNAARAAYLPSLSLNYLYGIDAPQFAVNGPGNVRNLGYAAFATVDIPVWDWLATHNKVKQSELRETAAKTSLSFSQKQLVAQLQEFYAEARTASQQLGSLEESVHTATESLNLTKLRYQAGEATALEVVDAENALTQAAAAQSGGALRYRIALANLQTLTGSL